MQYPEFEEYCDELKKIIEEKKDVNGVFNGLCEDCLLKTEEC